MALGLDAAIELPAPVTRQLGPVTMGHLTKLTHWPSGAPLEVSLEGRTATLRGTVATRHDRALAEQLLLLEPSVARVKNELQVGPVGATPGKSQPQPGPSPQTPASR